jgi:hypothetical protein
MNKTCKVSIAEALKNPTPGMRALSRVGIVINIFTKWWEEFKYSERLNNFWEKYCKR